MIKPAEPTPSYQMSRLAVIPPRTLASAPVPVSFEAASVAGTLALAARGAPVLAATSGSGRASSRLAASSAPSSGIHKGMADAASLAAAAAVTAPYVLDRHDTLDQYSRATQNRVSQTQGHPVDVLHVAVAAGLAATPPLAPIDGQVMQNFV